LELNTANHAELAAVFDTYYPLIYRYIYHHVGHVETAEDLAAKTFHRLLEQRAPIRDVRAWLLRVAGNLIVDDSRRMLHRDHAELKEEWVAEGEWIEERVIVALTVERTRAALRSLTPQQRNVIILRYLLELDHAEIAGVMETSTGAVKALQHRALAALRRCLASEGDQP
jgi:RNA polymerase sigma-70 factor (ECF subfamily)